MTRERYLAEGGPGNGRHACNAASAAFWLCVRAAAALWLLDSARKLSRGSAPNTTALLTLGAELMLVLLVGGAAGAGLALLVFVAKLPPRAARPLPSMDAARATRQWLEPQARGLRLRRSGLLLALASNGLIFAGLSYVVGRRIMTDVVRPEFGALALLGANLASALFVACLHPPLWSLCTWLAYCLGKWPRVGERLFGGPKHFAGVIGLGGLAASLGFVAHYRTPLSYLPWADALHVAAACLLAVAGPWLDRRLSPGARRTAQAGAALVLLSIGGLVWGLPESSAVIFETAGEDSLSGRVSVGTLRRGLDRDGDGHIPWLAGGDCGPDAPTIHPGALEIPNNGIDEDCDGRDLSGQPVRQQGAYRYPVAQGLNTRLPIVLITVDVLSARKLRALGERRRLLPHIDALAKDSAFFRSCFAQGPSTRLSFPAMFTSRWDTQIARPLHGKQPFPIDGSELMLAELMEREGYDTVAVLPDAYFSPRKWRGITAGFRTVDEAAFASSTKSTGAAVAERAIRLIEAPRKSPLFMWVHFYDAHGPRHQPPGAPRFGKSPEDLYDAQLAAVDEYVGSLLAGIDHALGENVIVLLTGDHGGAFDRPRHAKFEYGYQLSTAELHVPLIIRAPFAEPRNFDHPVSTLDIAPTLANLLGVTRPLPFQGESLVPELLGGEKRRTPIVIHQLFVNERRRKGRNPLARTSLRGPRYHLMHDHDTGRFTLYDYRADYFEQEDLSKDAQLVPLARRMQQQLLLHTYTFYKNPR